MEKIRSDPRVNDVVVIWECEWKKLRQTLKKAGVPIATGLAEVERLDPRKHLFGGRCEIFRMFIETEPNEKGVMLDFISLYPSVMLFGEFPCGHPEVICANFETDFSKYFGTAFIKILPPRDLYIPLLPWRRPGVGTFYTLCRTCTETMNIDQPCRHTDAERELTGCWITPMINRAVELGYTTQKVYEVHHYKERSKYNPETGQHGLFSKCMIEMLKRKIESSGFPKHITTEEQKRHYCHQHLVRMGLELDPANIHLNSGMRSVAKLACNCCWGSKSHLKGTLRLCQHVPFLFRVCSKVKQDPQHILR